MFVYRFEFKFGGNLGEHLLAWISIEEIKFWCQKERGYGAVGVASEKLMGLDERQATADVENMEWDQKLEVAAVDYEKKIGGVVFGLIDCG